jgi:hypothetical protein
VGKTSLDTDLRDGETMMRPNPTDFERMFPDWPMPRISSGGRIEVGTIGGSWHIFDECGNSLGTRAPVDPESSREHGDYVSARMSS